MVDKNGEQLEPIEVGLLLAAYLARQQRLRGAVVVPAPGPGSALAGMARPAAYEDRRNRAMSEAVFRTKGVTKVYETGDVKVYALAGVDPTKTKVISFDTVESAIDLLREGKVQVLLGQKYFGWGSEPVKILHGIKNGRMPATPIIDSGVDIVTRENAEAYLAEFKRLESGTN